MKEEKESLNIITRLLMAKFGQDKIEGLLLGTWDIEKSRPNKQRAYSRDKKNKACVFSGSGEDHVLGAPHGEWCVSPNSVIDALENAREEMNYSNWAAYRFDIAAEIIFRYCEQHGIPMEFHRKEA